MLVPPVGLAARLSEIIELVRDGLSQILRVAAVLATRRRATLPPIVASTGR